MKIKVSNMVDECPLCGGTGKHKSDLSARVTWLRKEARMTQDTFAKAIGIHRASVANIETGRHGLQPDQIIKVCQTFGVSSDWLLGLK